MSRRQPVAGAAALVAALALLVASCGDPQRDEGPADGPVGMVSSPIHSSHAGPPPWPHVLTCYGGCAPPHYDPTACNHPTSCGPIADGTWWYATERAAFYCGAKLELTRGNLCVVVDVQDNGPADWVEDQANSVCGTPYIIDTSPLVHDYFGGGCGWSECFMVDVRQVPDDTPTGPAGCNTCECTPGQEQSLPCGNCGEQVRTCAADCRWGSWSGCVGEGPCAPGAVETAPCCDCGTRTRICSAACQWSGFSACAGPDPDGGASPCETGQPGLCAAGTMRCLDGCLACVSNYTPEPERCDGVDNDCDGFVDDGSPTELGEPPPAYAAELRDVSLPAIQEPSSEATGWVRFRNVGTQPWAAGELTLVSGAARGGAPSPFWHVEWPAWDVAAVLGEGVRPGEDATFHLALAVGDDASRLADELVLQGPGATTIDCPSPRVKVEVLVGDPRSSDGPEGGGAPALLAETRAAPGCACSTLGVRPRQPSTPPPLGWPLALAALLLRGRRSGRRGRRRSV